MNYALLVQLSNHTGQVVRVKECLMPYNHNPSPRPPTPGLVGLHRIDKINSFAAVASDLLMEPTTNVMATKVSPT